MITSQGQLATSSINNIRVVRKITEDIREMTEQLVFAPTSTVESVIVDYMRRLIAQGRIGSYTYSIDPETGHMSVYFTENEDPWQATFEVRLGDNFMNNEDSLGRLSSMFDFV